MVTEDVGNGSPWEGIHAVYKPAGISSFAVVRKIRHAVGVKKVGHGGTLDPFAEGLLPIGIGRAATKQLESYLKGDKEYVAEVVLGVATDTYDLTGEVISTVSPEGASQMDIENAISKYLGEIAQTPPAFSALKVKGRRAYKLARQGEEVVLEPRKVTIREIELIEVGGATFKMRIVCSHGTYIRSLANDIGKDLGCGAHIRSLIRTRVGQLHLDDCLRMEDFQQEPASNTVGKL